MARHVVAQIGIIAIFAPLAIMVVIVIFLKLRRKRDANNPESARPPLQFLRRPPKPRLATKTLRVAPGLKRLTVNYLERRDPSEVLPIVTELKQYFREAARNSTPFKALPIHYITALLDAAIHTQKNQVREARVDLLIAERQLSTALPDTFEWEQALTLVRVAYSRYGNATETLLRNRIVLNKFELQWGFQQHWAFKKRIRISMADSWFSTATLQPFD